MLATSFLDNKMPRNLWRNLYLENRQVTPSVFVTTEQAQFSLREQEPDLSLVGRAPSWELATTFHDLSVPFTSSFIPVA